MWSEACEIASSMAAQLGEDTIHTMTTNELAAFVRREMPGESYQVRANVLEALRQMTGA